MPAYFSINDGDFTSGLGTVVGNVSAGTSGFFLSTTYSYPTTLASTVADSIYGVAFQLSSIGGTPTGTVDIILSATNGSSTTVSVPVSGLTQFTSNTNITPNYPVSWQVFAFDAPVTFPTGRSMRVGIKTSVANKVALIGASLADLNRSYITTTLGVPAVGIGDVVHIVGTLSSTGLVTRTVNYNTDGAFGNFYVHNGGILNFDPTLSVSMRLSGAQGMQITPNGTVNIGTSSNPVGLSNFHDIFLNNCYINVNNGASFNVYGVYKTPYTSIREGGPAGHGMWPYTNPIINWVANSGDPGSADLIYITPNNITLSSAEIYYIYNIDYTNKILFPWTPSLYPHISSTHIPGLINITRNVRFEGINSSGGYIRFLDGSRSNINNARFKGFKNATYKGMQFATNSTGSVSLSNCIFNGDAVATMPAFSFEATKSPVTNVSIKNCSFYGYGATTDIITLAALSTNNFTFTDNIVLSASQNGMLIDRLSSNYADIKNNYLIGNRQHGLRSIDPYILSGSIGGIGCMNNFCGSVVNGSNTIPLTSVRLNYDGLAGHYNFGEGVNIQGTLRQLSSTVFKNLTANNNNTSGFLLSGNANALLSAVNLNINGLVANENTQEGFEAYAVTGNLSSFNLNDNKRGNIYTSIGNGDIIFDGITSRNTSSYFTNSFNPLVPYGYHISDPFGWYVDGSAQFSVSNYTLSTNDNNLSFDGDFTIEGWLNAIDVNLDTRARRVFSFGANVANGLQLIVGTNDAVAGDVLSVYTNTPLIVGTTPVKDYYSHFAISRVNGVLRFFRNGIQEGAAINDTTNYNAGSTSPFVIGRYAGAVNGRYSGFISNLRILKDVGYSSNFTVPTTTYSYIPGTVFLFKGENYLNNTYGYVPLGNVNVLSGQNYGATTFKNSVLLGNNTNAVKLNSTKFEQFSIESSTLSSNYEDLGTARTRNLLEGSYLFNNVTFGTGILSSNISDYQTEIFLENGFAVMKENGVSNKHYRLLQAGKISLDTTLAYGTNTVSEKLEPTSTTTKLRCGSKMVPVNKNETYTVGVYVRKSASYSGDAPRLMLKRNTALGYSDTVLATSVSANDNWELLSGVVPAALDQGIFEVYVDCSGASGSGSVNIDNWSLT